MKKIKTYLVFALSLTLVVFFVYAGVDTKEKRAEAGYIKGSGRCPAIVIVWEEKSDNTRGSKIVEERWLGRDERLGPYNTERGRIIYDYKYRSDDTWKTDNHAWMHRGEETKIP